jgi:hypothetical protein
MISKNIISLIVILLISINVYANKASIGKRGLKFIDDAKKELIDNLNDPESAKIRKLMYFNDQNNNIQVLCGEINAKNRMGGYVGYEKFFIASNGRYDIGQNDHTQYYDSYCTNRDKRGIELK